MDQERIGKFIAECRKAKGITQSDLAEQLGVTDRSVSNWETGKNMPDLSLFKPLCEILCISINELLSGKKIDEKVNDKIKFDENIVNTIDYSLNKLNKYKILIFLILVIFGLFISMSAIMIFPSESSWGSIYSVLGILVFMVGISRLLHPIKWYKRLFLLIIIFTISMMILLFTDYVNVKMNDEAPMFRIRTTTTGNVIYYDTPFYDVYRCNFDEKNEYWVVSKNSNPTIIELINYCK